MDFELRPLPYAYDALEPHIRGVTVETHYEKHHRGYVEKLARLLAGQSPAARSLEQLILEVSGPVYDNAAQIWNHDFYRRSMCEPNDRSERPKHGLLSARIDGAFGSIGALWWRLADAAEHLFGSG